MKTLLTAVFLAISSIAFGQLIMPTPTFSLLGNPSITRQSSPYEGISGSVTSSFNLKISATGDDYSFSSLSFVFDIFRNGQKISVHDFDWAATSFGVPSSGVVTTGLVPGQLFKVEQGNEITLPITFTFPLRASAQGFLSSGIYAVGFNSIHFLNSNGTATGVGWMGLSPQWMTSGVNLGLGDFNPIAVPEPSTYCLIGVGILVCLVSMRRRKSV